MALNFSIQFPKDGDNLEPNKEFLCFGFATDIDFCRLGKLTHLVAQLTTPDGRLVIHGHRIPTARLPLPPKGFQPFDWGFHFPLLPAVFYRQASRLSVRLILDDGTTIDAEPHTIGWKARGRPQGEKGPAKTEADPHCGKGAGYGDSLSIDGSIPSGLPSSTSISRRFSVYGQASASAYISVWLSNTTASGPLLGMPDQAPPSGEIWQWDFDATSWDNPPSGTTTLWAQSTDFVNGTQTTSVSNITFTN